MQPSATPDRKLVAGAGVSGSSPLVGSPFCPDLQDEREIYWELGAASYPCTATVLQPEALRECADVASWERVRSRKLYLYAIAGAALEVYAEKWLERAWNRGQPRVRQDNVTAANEPLGDNLRYSNVSSYSSRCAIESVTIQHRVAPAPS